MLKKSGHIPTLISLEMEQAALARFYRKKSRAWPQRPHGGERGRMRKDKILAILVDFPDYPDYSPAHYNDLPFSSKGYAGPNGERFISMRQIYEQQSGQARDMSTGRFIVSRH